MSVGSTILRNIPTNIITGFLGVGKTTAILHLLKNKPEGERWAVLINEFGEIGVDASLMQGQQSGGCGVYIREVPGGCMCCSSGLPMQVALNTLLISARPDRLLIEPSGLSHPREVYEELSGGFYKGVLDVKNTITIVDARHMQSERYISNDTYVQQLSIADVVLANKRELYSQNDTENLHKLVNLHCKPDVQISLTSNGSVELDYLGLNNSVTSAGKLNEERQVNNIDKTEDVLLSSPLPECGYVKAQNEENGFNSIGWRFSKDKIFSHLEIFSFLNGVSAERVKAAVVTDQGLYGYNLASGVLSEFELNVCEESRIEILSELIDEAWDEALLGCLVR